MSKKKEEALLQPPYEFNSSWETLLENEAFVNVFLSDVKKGEYNICLFDLQSREVNEVFSGHLTSGDHYFTLSADELNLEQGIYILSISKLNSEASRKIIVR